MVNGTFRTRPGSSRGAWRWGMAILAAVVFATTSIAPAAAADGARAPEMSDRTYGILTLRGAAAYEIWSDSDPAKACASVTDPQSFATSFFLANPSMRAVGKATGLPASLMSKAVQSGYALACTHAPMKRWVKVAGAAWATAAFTHVSAAEARAICTRYSSDPDATVALFSPSVLPEAFASGFKPLVQGTCADQ